MNHMFGITFLIVIMFILSGIHKIHDIDKVARGLQKRTFIDKPFWIFKFLIILAILLQIIGPSLILYSSWTNENKNYALTSIFLLIVFTILATIVYHPLKEFKYNPAFMSNMTTIGGLMMLGSVFINIPDVRKLEFNVTFKMLKHR